MFILNFAKWNSKSTSLFVYKRLYKNGYKWTPIVQVSRRYFDH